MDPHASSSGGDGPSTSTGGSSRRQRHWDFLPALVIGNANKNPKELALRELLLAVQSQDIRKARKYAKRLREMGTGLDEAVEAEGRANRKSKRHGPLHFAAFTKYLEMTKMLVKEYGCNPDATDADDATPLFFAILGEGSQAVIQYLIDSGADPKKANNRGRTPLHLAAARGSCEIAEYLLSKGVNVDPLCQDGEAPLHVAARYGHVSMVNLLLKHDADRDRLSRYGRTPLVASLGSSLECLEAFIQAGAAINTDSPVTPLSVAARKGLADYINRLLENGADPYEIDEGGKLPIEIAASRGSGECIEILLPVTNPPLGKFADMSIDQMIKHETAARLLEEDRAIADGDAAYWGKNYDLALQCYTKALRLGSEVRELHAKRSLCHLYRHDVLRYLDEAMSFRKAMELSCTAEEDAKQLVLLYGSTWREKHENSLEQGSGPSGSNLADETRK